MTLENKILLFLVLLWAMVAGLFLSGGVIFWEPIHTFTWALMWGWVFLFALGYVSLQPPVFHGAPLGIKGGESFNLGSLIVMYSLLSLLGSFLLFFDFSVLRGYGFATGANEIRIQEVDRLSRGEGGGSSLSGIGRLLGPALMCAWLLAAPNMRELSKKVLAVLGVSTVASMVFHVLFSGGRFDILNLILVSLFAAGLARAAKGRLRLGARERLAVGTILGVAFAFFAFFFISRANGLYADFDEAFRVALRPHPGDPTTYQLFNLQGENSGLYIIVGYFWLYMTQGIAHLDILVHHQGLEHAFGMFQFNQLAHIGDRLFGTDLVYNPYENLPVVGVYSTILGSMYVDFGIYGALLVAPVLGLSSYVSIRTFLSQKPGLVKYFAPLLLAFLVLAPCVSTVSNIWLSFAWLFFGVIVLWLRQLRA